MKRIWPQNRKRFIVLQVLLILALGGCATYNAATGRQEFIVIPTNTEVSMGREIHQQLLEQNKLSNDPGLTARVNRIGAKISQVSDRQDYAYHFYVIEKDDLNAFTTPGGNVYVYTGLLKKLSSDAEIAAVLAHEVGHCAAKHTIKKFQAAMSYNILESVLFSASGMGDAAKQIAAMGSGAVTTIIFSAYGRGDEFQADLLGVKYMSLAGYDLNGMIQTLEVLRKESKGPQVPLILRTHPYLEDRIAAVKKEIQRIEAEGRYR